MILITGGLGFIGLHTARRFLDVGENVVLTQFRVRREPDFIKEEIGKRVFIERLDVTSAHDVIEVVRKHKVTGVVHLAVPALAALSAAEDYRVNVMGFLNILEAARVSDVKRVTWGSSVSVYGGIPEGPFREDTLLPVESRNPTETFKKALEILGAHFGNRTGLEVVAMRIGGPFGPLYHTLAAATSRIVHSAVKGVPADFKGTRTGVPHENDEVGAFYVKDCATGIQLLQMAEKLSHRTYNISGDGPHTYREFTEAVKKAVPNAQVELQPGQGPRQKTNAYMEINRLREDVGFKPQYDLERGVADYIGWLRNNPV